MLIGTFALAPGPVALAHTLEVVLDLEARAERAAAQGTDWSGATPSARASTPTSTTRARF